MLTAVDVLDPVPRRVLIAGVTGAGKTTLAVRVGTRHSMPDRVLPLEREHPHLRVVRLRSTRDVETWVARLATSA